MAFNLIAVLTDNSAIPTLQSLEDALRFRLASDPARVELTVEPGAPPMMPPHLRFRCLETDSGEPGDWYALIHIESGADVRDGIRQCVAESRNRCPDSDSVRSAETWVRIHFHDDPDANYTNTVIALTVFLQRLEGAVVYDPQQSEFTP